MSWHVVHTKPRQELRALENLQRQHYTCLLPVLGVQRLRQGRLVVAEEPLFPRYLFIELDEGTNWAPIRSTFGVAGLVRFGSSAAKVPESVVEELRRQQAQRASTDPARLMFTPGQTVHITAGPFAGLPAVFEMTDGDARAMVLIELMSRQVRLGVGLGEVRPARLAEAKAPASTTDSING